MSKPLQRLRCQYDGDFYLMDLSRDRFVHFTTRDRAAEIMESGRLLMRPPYKKFGIDAVAAVSTVWGMFLPGVQTTHYKRDDLVAVVFQTNTLPEYGVPEEVIWKRDVVLKGAKIVSFDKAKSMLQGGLDGDFQVYYKTPSWCSGPRTADYRRDRWRSHPRMQEAVEKFGEPAVEELVYGLRVWLLDGIGRNDPEAKMVARQNKVFRFLSPPPSVPSMFYRGLADTPESVEEEGLYPASGIESWTTNRREAESYCMGGTGVVVAARGANLTSRGQLVLWPLDTWLLDALLLDETDEWAFDVQGGVPLSRWYSCGPQASRVASRYMQAGLLDVPPKVVDDVYQWCMERLCSEWLEHELPYKREQIRRKLESAEGWQRDFQENRLINLKLVEREAKKWGRAGASFGGRQGNTWRGYIDTDFSGWRYASEIRTRTGKTPDELAKEMRKDRFFLTLMGNQNLDGKWIPSTSHRGWSMEIRTNFDPHDLKTWRSRTQELRKVIAHETGHLAQSYLDLFLNLGTPGEDVPTSGLPGSDLAEPGYDPLGNKLTLYGNPISEMSGREEHALREVEFYTRLRDDVEDFVRMAKRIPKSAWREALRVWVAADERSYSDPLRFMVPGEPSRDVRNSDFFKTIKQNRRKWQKAVSLFVDEVGKRISIPSAARVASASLRGAFMRHTSDQYDEWLTDTYEEDADEVRDDPDVFDDFLDETFGIEINDTHKAVELSYADDDNEWLLRKVDPPVLLYHHTTDAFKDSIRREGLRVGQERSDRLVQNTQSGVYLTLEGGGTVPRGYIQNAIRNYGGRPLSLTVRADWSDLWPDPDDADISTGRSQFVTSYVPPRDIVEYD